jgi:hypothetical protein
VRLPLSPRESKLVPLFENLQRNKKFPMATFFQREFFLEALSLISRGRALAGKEVMNMKSIKSLMSVVFLTGALGLSALSAGAENVISQDVLTDGSYCRAKFESIREETLASSD